MTTVRQKILGYFNKTRFASAREIGRALQLSSATVQHHLRVLASDGRLEIAAVRGSDRKGRPEKVYGLPRSALGDNLAPLSDALLAEAGTGLEMDALAKHLIGNSSFTGQPLVKRLNLTVEKMNKMSYHARWEAGSEGPRVIFSHCPYAAIIAKHPELCRMDASILKEWLGQPATQIAKIGKDGSSVCVFSVGR